MTREELMLKMAMSISSEMANKEMGNDEKGSSYYYGYRAGAMGILAVLLKLGHDDIFEQIEETI